MPTNSQSGRKIGLNDKDIRSKGCLKDQVYDFETEKVVQKTITINDPELGSIERTYQVVLPTGYDYITPIGMIMRFHGQGDTYPKDEWNEKGVKSGYIVVQPRGMDDNDDSTIAWNTGLFDKGYKKAYKTCFKNTIGTCYKSCQKLENRCNACSWTSCYDDGLFIEKLMETLKQDYCINLYRIYGTGQSNGGMMLYYLVGRYPKMFNAIKIAYGSNLVGTGRFPEKLNGVDLLHLHGRSDVTIPLEGLTEDGWIYESIVAIHDRWARAHNCTIKMGMSDFKTPYDGADRNMSCQAKVGCKGEIIKCMYDGGHGDLPEKQVDLALWFYDRVYLNRLNEANDIIVNSI